MTPEQKHIAKWQIPKPPEFIVTFIQVIENALPPESLHQEGASCRIGTKIYIIGGSNATLHEYSAQYAHNNMDVVINSARGSGVVTIYDMEDMSVKFGPTIPYQVNHASCALAPDGVTLHVTGGYNQGARNPEELAHAHHFSFDTSVKDSVWVKKADMPLRTGAHGCAFMADGHMYCVGGGKSQWGPFRTDLMIYDPSVDTWEMGPSMETPRDHLYETVTAIDGGFRLYVAGGRSHTQKHAIRESSPQVFSNVNTVEIYNLKTKSWRRMRDLSAVRGAIAVIPYHRRGLDEVPNLLLIGGEEFLGLSGSAFRIIDEYDVQNDLYFCLPPLAWPYFGGGLGIHDGKLHVVGGGEWLGLSASRRVQVYDLNKAPPPKHCFYEPTPVFDQWERTWDKVLPWPDINNYQSRLNYEWHSINRAEYEDIEKWRIGT